MSTLKFLFQSRKLLFLSCFFLLYNSIFSQTQTLESDRSVNWSLSGFRGTIPSPSNEINIEDFGGIGDSIFDNSTAFQSALNSLNGNPGVIIFPTGNYFFTTRIDLTDGIVLRGAGSDSTTLRFDLGGSNNLINVFGSVSDTTRSFLEDANQGDTQISIQNTAGLLPGDYIRIAQVDTALVTSSWAVGRVGQIIKIEEVDNANTLTLASDLRKSYILAEKPTIRKINVVKNVGIECLKLTRVDETNPRQTSSVRFHLAAQCWITGIESDICNFAHVTINASTNITVSGSYFHHAFNYGGGGRAYGVMIQQTGNESRVENNIFEHLRHSMIVQSGANRNVFGYNYSIDPFWTGTSFPDNAAGDMVCHGNYTYANLFESNIAQQAVVDGSHGQNGPFNTFFRSREDLYGIFVTDTASHSQNFIGNEITKEPDASSEFLGSYFLLATDHFEHGNNIRGTILPTGTNSLSDDSYYQTGAPEFYPLGYPFPSIGIPNPIGSGSIPARDRYELGGNLTECPASLSLLPVELISFTGKIWEEHNIRLHWETASEVNNNYFLLEKSRDGIQFETLTKVESGFSNQRIRQYNFVDKNPFSGNNYYRLAQVDLDGTKTYFSIINTFYENKNSDWKIYPSVFSQNITVKTDGEISENTFVILKNINGQAVFKEKLNITTQSFNVNHLPAGLYFLFIQDGNRMLVTRKTIKS